MNVWFDELSIRDALIDMLLDVEEDRVVWRTISRAFTREELVREIRDGSDIGNQYCSELLRVSRDMIVRKAAREDATIDPVPSSSF
jgi:hypothetical protein